MARKPVHLTAAHGAAKRPGRQGVWEAIRACQRFTVADLERYTRTPQDTIRRYLTGLARAGYIQRVGDGPHRYGLRPPALYALTRDVGVEAPRVTREGEPVTQGAGREQMWRVSKIMGQFTARQLAVQASTEAHPVSVEDAKQYARYLARAGYLQVVEQGCPGHTPLYRFISRRNSGPEAPQVQRVRQVFDPNLGRVVWRSGGDS